MHYTYSLPFVNVTRTPIDEPPVKIELLSRGSVVRVKIKGSGTVEMSPDELVDVYNILSVDSKTRAVATQLEKFDLIQTIELLSEVISDIKLHRSVA